MSIVQRASKLAFGLWIKKRKINTVLRHTEKVFFKSHKLFNCNIHLKTIKLILTTVCVQLNGTFHPINKIFSMIIFNLILTRLFWCAVHFPLISFISMNEWMNEWKTIWKIHSRSVDHAESVKIWSKRIYISHSPQKTKVNK